MLSGMQISKVVSMTKSIPELKLEESEPKVAEEYMREIDNTKQKHESFKSNELNQYENEGENANEAHEKPAFIIFQDLDLYTASRTESFKYDVGHQIKE